MNSLSAIWQQGWQTAGWTMVYFLALGTLVVLAGGIVRWLCRRAPQLRYSLSLAILTATALLPFAIAAWLMFNSPPTLQVAEDSAKTYPETIELMGLPSVALSELPTISAAPQSSQPTTPSPLPPGSSRLWLPETFIGYLPWLWLIGTPLTFILLATGLIGAERLRHSSQMMIEGPVYNCCQRLAIALGIERSVAVAVCDRVATPLLVGILRPLILLPPAAVTGLSAEELEMVLLHELAHVRRWDNLVNLLQRVIESLLFFHPGVWIASRWVRRDREDCCDVIVLRHTAKPQAYAELLVAMASNEVPLAGLAMARHPLAARIRRILKLEDEPMLVSRRTLTTIGLLIAGVLVTVSCYKPANTEAEEAVAVEEVVEEETEAAEVAEITVEEFGRYGTPEPIASDSTKPFSFPSLEEQKAADLAFKLLGVELERLTPEELQQVREAGYEGGLRVAYGMPAGPFGLNDTTGRLMQSNLLVGLHVWPITSLEDVLKVLARDDLDELSPLKFYALRDDTTKGGWNYEILVTGRIPLSLDQWKKQRQRTASDSASSSTKASVDKNSLELFQKTLNFQISALQNQIEQQQESMNPGPSQPISVRREAAKQRHELLLQLRELATLKDTLGKLEKNKSLKWIPLDTHATIAPSNRYATAPRQKNTWTLENRKLRPSDVVHIHAIEVYPDYPINGEFRIESSGTVALGPRYGRAKVAGMSLVEAEQSVKEHLSKILQKPEVQITLVQMAGEQSVIAHPGAGNRYDPAPQPTLPGYVFPTEPKLPESNQTEPGPVPTLASPQTSESFQQVPEEPTLPQQVDDHTHEHDNLQSSKRVKLYLFYDPERSKPCREMEQLLEKVKQRKRVRFSLQKVDVSKLPDEANKFHIARVPTLLTQAGGETLEYSFDRTAKDIEKFILSLSEPVSSPGSDPSPAPTPRATPTLLYDGKTFEWWRDAWRTELKTEKRIEYIEALVAFSRVGHGKEAAEAILEVAEEYDYCRPGGSDKVDKLKEAIFGAFRNSYGVPATDWLPLVVERLEKEPENWRHLAGMTLAYVHGDQPDVVNLLKTVATSPQTSGELRGAALTSLIRQDGWLEQGDIVALVHDALQGEDSLLASSVMGALGFRYFDLFPEQLDLLFHEDKQLHYAALNGLTILHDYTHASEILDRLLGMLANPKRSEDHLRVISTLGHMSSNIHNNPALRKRKLEVAEALQALLVEGDKALLPWSIKTLKALTSQSETLVIRDTLTAVSAERAEQLKAAAEEAKNLVYYSGGYGGFGGGGGGGFF